MRDFICYSNEIIYKKFDILIIHTLCHHICVLEYGWFHDLNTSEYTSVETESNKDLPSERTLAGRQYILRKLIYIDGEQAGSERI